MNIPRICFAHLPTPIEFLPRLGAALGGLRILVKRDDQTGLAFGGNKTRKLEYVLAEALANGAKTLVTVGAAQSNHCRQTAALAARYNLGCVLVLSGTPPDSSSGNLLLDGLFGAEVVWCSSEARNEVLKSTFDRAWEEGRRPYLIPLGASNATGAVAYTAAFDEMIEQVGSDLPDWIVVVSISGGHILAEERLAAQEADIRDIAQQHGLQMVSALQGIRGEAMLGFILQPSPEPYWKLRYKGGSQEVFFLTLLNKAPSFVASMVSLANEEQYPVPDIGIYLQPVHQGVGCHCEFILPFDRANQAETQKTQELFRKASHRLFKQGAYFSRPYGIWADMVYKADARTTVVSQKIKDIFDPKHVMNPGKLCF